MSALAGIRVLDLTQVLSGPFCTQMLGDLGAEIIKVEGPQTDIARGMPPYYVGGDSVYFLSVNRNKHGLVADMKTPEGRAIVRRLALASDIVIENFRPGVCARLGLSSDELRAEKPGLIWCSISGFGQNGPYRDKAAYDLVVQALSGGMSLTGERDGVSVRAGIPIADLAAGMYAATAVLAALHRRDATGRGDVIDISMLDCQVALLSYQAAFCLHSGNVPGRQGREHDSIATYGTFRTRGGGELVIAALDDRMWRSLCRALGCEALLADPRFRTAADRAANRAVLVPILERLFLARPAEEWMELLEARNIAVGTLNTIDRVVQDPQIVHREMIVDLADDAGHRLKVPGNPMVFAEARSAVPAYPPAPGAHTEEILRNVLGLSEQQIGELRQAGVVRAPPDAHGTPERTAAMAGS